MNYAIKAASKGVEILIYDEIVPDLSMERLFFGLGVSASDVMSQLEANPNSAVTVRIASEGGSVREGIKMYNAFLRHNGKVTMYVDELAASMAGFLLGAADEVIMMPGSKLMLHEPSGGLIGTAEDHRQIAELLDSYENSLVGLIARNNRKGMTAAEISDKINGTDWWMSDVEAVDYGFADRVASVKKNAKGYQIAACLDNIPDNIKQALNKSQIMETENKSIFAQFKEFLGAAREVSEPAIKDLEAKLEASESSNTALKAQLADLEAKNTKITELEKTVETLTAQLEAAKAGKPAVDAPDGENSPEHVEPKLTEKEQFNKELEASFPDTTRRINALKSKLKNG